MDEPTDNRYIVRRPKPSRALVINAAIFCGLAVIAGVFLGSIGLWQLNHDIGTAIVALIAAFVILGSAYGEFRAVFRRRHGVSIWMTTFFFVSGFGCAGLTGLTCISTNMRGIDHDESLWVIGFIAAATYLFCSATQMHEWSKRLRHYHIWKPFCRNCGYNLRGTMSAGVLECPECGHRAPYEKLAVYGPPRDQSLPDPSASRLPPPLPPATTLAQEPQPLPRTPPAP